MIQWRRYAGKVQSLWEILLRAPRRYTVALPIILLAISGLAGYFWPQTVELHYAQKTCFSHFTAFPGLYKQKPTAYSLESGQPVRLGAVTLAARQLCVTPKAVPEAGSTAVIWSLFGLPVGQRIIVQAAAHPQASLQAFEKAVPASKPLILPLDKSDTLFSYRLVVGDRAADCHSKDRQLSCDVPALKLVQGTTYTVRLMRYFQAQQVGSAMERTMTTLSATTVTSSSITAGSTVYDKPKSLRLGFDKQIVRVDAVLQRVDQGKPVPVATTVELHDKAIAVGWPGELDRSAQYALTLKNLEATDGSSLVEAYSLPFKVSGGPKVTNISIDSFDVPPGSIATITFDQPLSDKQGAGGGLSVSGGATIISRQENRVTVSLAGAPRCGAVSLRVTDDIRSSYDIGGGSAWSFNTRMRCHQLRTIGTSTSGRPITAYVFGDGTPQVVYTGAIHGNESSTRSLLFSWVDELEANATRIPSGISLAVIPSLNPDGVAQGRRTNGRNIDLNRNFATSDWQSDITTVNNEPFPGGGGASPLSEPESQAIASYIASTRPRLVISYHSIGGLLAANQYGNSIDYASLYAARSGYHNATGSSSTFEYAISGTADDYYGQQLGVGSVLVELGSHSDPQLARNKPAMWAMLES